MQYPYQNNQLSVEERVSDLLPRMMLEEKVGQMMQLPATYENFDEKLESWHIGSFLHCTGELIQQLQERASKTRLGIPLLFGIDAIHGNCFDNNATVFPTQLALSCSWNSELVYQMARITAKETRAVGLHWTFSPVLCVGRDPRWGRIDETFGEDPWLIGELAAAAIRGYQNDSQYGDQSLLACAKHYVGYGESVGGRDSYESDTSPRKLLSLFLPPFEKAVKDAGVATLMAGYQAIDGVPCSASHWLLTEVAKQDWGLEGFIVTDWDNIGSLHTKQKVAADLKDATRIGLLAGNDMVMTTPTSYQDAIDLVKEGAVPESVIDNAVIRILRQKFKLGLFDEQRFANPELLTSVGCDEHWLSSLKASQQSIVLLKNDGILPLCSDSLKRVLLIGPNADDVIAQLGDWSFGSMQARAADDSYHRDQTITPLIALQQAAEEYNFALDYVKGADTVDACFDETALVAEKAKSADIIIACVGDTLSQHGEFHDRSDLNMTGKQQQLLEVAKASGKPLIVSFIASKPLTIPWIKENADALICQFNPGCFGGTALKQALFGELNPGGRLTISFPHNVGQLPVFYSHYEGWHAQLSEQTNGEERYIDAPLEPLFAFGEGLSYSEIEYGELALANDSLATGEALSVTVTVTNLSDVAGTEVVQLYINDLFSSVTTPIKSLRAYARVELEAHESKRVDLSVPFDELSLINQKLEKVVEAGEFEVMVGCSSRDADLKRARFWVA